MQTYILRRLLLAVPVLFGVSILIFSLVRLVPGDVVMQMLAETGNLEQKDIDVIRNRLGLDRPFHEQYIIWVGGLLRGDMGQSLWTRKPVRSELLERIPVSAELAILSLIVALVIAIPVGIVSATRQDTWLDYVGRLFAISGLSMPSFWIGTLLIVLLALWFRYSPPFGYVPFFKDPLANLQQFIFPALVLGFSMAAVTMRMTRSAMLEVLRQDYIRTAWAKGLRERIVIYRHALKNSMIPVITLVGNQFSYLLGGTVIIETLFVLPGVGRLTVDAISQRDYTQLQGNVMFMAVVMVAMNLIVDVSYAWFDPRIRYR